jgi:hypothetical protein
MTVEAQQEWILQWLCENLEASALTAKFHNEFHARFGGTRKEYLWGACPVPRATAVGWLFGEFRWAAVGSPVCRNG